jgi:starch phosphorylase
VNSPPREVAHGQSIPIEVAAHLGTLDPGDVMVECVLGRENELRIFVPVQTLKFEITTRNKEGEAIFKVDLHSPALKIPLPGLQSYKIRIYPYHPLLSHPFETGCMLWL